MPKKLALEEVTKYIESFDYKLLTKCYENANSKMLLLCDNFHEYYATFGKFKNGKRCPHCKNKKVGYGNDLLTNYPELCEEWDCEKNELGPENYTPGSKFIAWWLCPKCSASYDCKIQERVRGNGCPYCSGKRVGYGNDLLTNFPDIAKQWHPTKNKLGPENYTPGSHHEAWWICDVCCDYWSSAIKNRTKRGSGCPTCYGQKVTKYNSLLYLYSELCKEWHPTKNRLGPENYRHSSNYKAWWLCRTCGHEYKTKICHRTLSGSGCKVCSKGSSVSKISQKWLDNIGVKEREIWLSSIRVRVDGFDSKTNTVYEFLGDYYHGNPKVKNPNNFFDAKNNITFDDRYNSTLSRFRKIKSNGYKIIYIWENDYKEGKNPQEY